MGFLARLAERAIQHIGGVLCQLNAGRQTFFDNPEHARTWRFLSQILSH